MRQALRLAELLCARLCNDIGTPLGTLAAALDLSAGQNTAGAIAVADAATAAIWGRVRLLRAAWAGECGGLDSRGIAELLAPLGAAQRVEIDLAELDPMRSFPPHAARLLLNLAMLAAEGLPAGGAVVLSGSATQDVLIEIDGPRAGWPAGLASAFADENAAWAALERPHGIQLALTALLAHASGLRVSVLMSGAPMEIAPPLLLTLDPVSRA